MKMQKGVLREKEILSVCNSQFIIRLHATFKTQEHLYFLLEPALGGELFATYHKYHFHGSVSKAKFYSASVVFAFEHLHERSVLYRDLKPENLLLDSKGFCKLTDMGLAKIVRAKTYTTCGTPDYFAPEVI
jgi:protein kinase A